MKSRTQESKARSLGRTSETQEKYERMKAKLYELWKAHKAVHLQSELSFFEDDDLTETFPELLPQLDSHSPCPHPESKNSHTNVDNKSIEVKDPPVATKGNGEVVTYLPLPLGSEAAKQRAKKVREGVGSQ